METATATASTEPRRWEAPEPYTEAVRFARRYLWIRDKRSRLRPLIPSAFQRIYLEAKARAVAQGRPRRFLCLKSRRGGITTWEQAESYHCVTVAPHRRAVTLAHDLDSTQEIFDIAGTFWRSGFGPAKPTAGRSHRRELLFHGASSRFFIGTAGGEGFGRGFTLTRVHGSEVAKWPGSLDQQRDLLAGLTEACSHGEMVLESTANGAAGLFWELCEEARLGEGPWTLIFLPWWIDENCRVPVTAEQVEILEASLTPEEEALIERHGLTPGQVAWRRMKKQELKRLFPQEYPESPTEAFLQSGHCFFDLERLADLERTCRDPVTTRDAGRLAVWHGPEVGHTYVIGCDASEGIPGRDRSAAVVVDFDTGAQCARLWGYWRPHEFGALIVKLAKIYGWATIAPESNNHGHSVLNTILVQEGYPSNGVYHRLQVDQGTTIPVRLAGWETNAKTRPLLLDGLNQILETPGVEVNDRELLAECRTFTLQESGKYQAAEGHHDDLVMAWGIAYAVRALARPGSGGVLMPQPEEVTA